MAKLAKPTIFLMGDTPLVEELAMSCHEAGVSVAGNPNEPSGAKRLRRYLTIAKSIPRTTTLAFELTNSDINRKRKNLRFLEKHSPVGSVIGSSSIIVTASQQAEWLRSPQRLVGIGALPTLLSRDLVEIAPTRLTDQSVVRKMGEFLTTIRKQRAVVQDRVGMVMPRILCMIINEAAFALTEGIASPTDIDSAMKLGTHYPFGPIEWGDKIGFPNVCAVLNAMYEDMHEERYRVSPLLKQLASGARWWNT